MTKSKVTPAPEEPSSYYGSKADQGKVQPRLLFEGLPRALQAISEVLTMGANKYAPSSWRKVPNRRARYTDAFYRHHLAQLTGEERDPESGLLHEVHAVTNLLFLLELRLSGDVDSSL